MTIRCYRHHTDVNLCGCEQPFFGPLSVAKSMEKKFMPDANPWTPMTDIKDLQVLGKLIEETTECASAASRCIIQGINETEPSTNKLNRKWLEDEIADVEANIKLTKEHFRLAEHRIRERSAFKEDYLRKWHNL